MTSTPQLFFRMNPRTTPQAVRSNSTKNNSENPHIPHRNLQLILSRKLDPRILSVSRSTASVLEKARSLDIEFRSLPEPLDRVKKLLQYAAHLRPLDESSRIQENRVAGCTAQVWLEVEMDRDGLMRYGVDSDSEIARGFCSCLVWLLDGAEPDEVLCVTAEDLAEINVGLPSRKSRVNAWHNVLISMQKRTRDLVKERDMKDQCMDGALSSLVVVTGNCKETIAR